jgi:hypothetical protein
MLPEGLSRLPQRGEVLGRRMDVMAKASSMGWAAVLATALVVCGGCDDLDVREFAGTNLQLQLVGSNVTPPGQHFEMWGRNHNDDILRIGYRLASGQPQLYGFIIRIAIRPDDPCMINDTGYLVTDPRAYPKQVNFGGVTQTDVQQALAIKLRIQQVTALAAGGLQPTNLLLTMPVDETPVPALAADASPDERRAACQAYWDTSPYAYTPQPLTVAQPKHGATMGPVAYQTSMPQASYDGIYLTSLYDLDDLQEFWITVESVPPDQVDLVHRGPTYLQGYRVERGLGYVNFDLTGSGSVHGSLLVVQSRGAF